MDEKSPDRKDTLEAQYNDVKKIVWGSARPIDTALELIHALLVENRRQQTVMRAAYVELEEGHCSPRAVSLKRALLGEEPSTIYPNMLTPEARDELLGEIREKLTAPQSEYHRGPSPMIAKFAFDKDIREPEKT
jgi:hypothetical protein